MLVKQITPRRAIKRRCIDCCGYSRKEIKACAKGQYVSNCVLWYFINNLLYKGKKLTACKAIKQECLMCQCDDYKGVLECPDKKCDLYKFRFGKNPNIQLSEEERKRRAKNLEKVRAMSQPEKDNKNDFRSKNAERSRE